MTVKIKVDLLCLANTDISYNNNDNNNIYLLLSYIVSPKIKR